MIPNHPEESAQIVYFSHGGGPLPILGDPGHQAMVDFMRQLPSKLSKPAAILVISAHWEENATAIFLLKSIKNEALTTGCLSH